MTQTRKSYFRPRARLVSLLGEQLISDSAVGLIELVKNSFDADATQVSLSLEELEDPDSTSVIIQDNGHGMSPRHVREHWLSPATGNKESRKARAERTPMGRQLIGEKGVGRFAVQRLGRQVRLITRAPGYPEVQVEIDWGDFEQREVYLDEVTVQVRTMKRATHFRKGSSGTRIEMYGARTPWTRTELRKVQRMLRRLQNPLRASNDFHVTLSCPEFPDYEDIDPSSILDTAHYTFEGQIDGDGVLSWSYSCALPGSEAREAQGKDRLAELIAEELAGDAPRCGPLSLTLHVWDRSRDMMRAVKLTDRELNAHCGISIYRDGFRVLPYGEVGDDWLGLDARRINVPSRRVGNRNIVGVVEISHEGNPTLRDRTSREGIIENEAYTDLRAMIRGAIIVFEVERLRDRTATESHQERLGAVTALTAASAQVLPVAVESSRDELPGLDAAADTRQSRQFIATALHERELEARHEELYHLAASGLRMDRLGHQFSRHADRALRDLARLRQTLTGDARALEQLESVNTTLNMLRNAMRDLAPEGLVAQAERTEVFSLSRALHEALVLHADEISSAGVVIERARESEDLEVRGRRSCIIQVMENVLGNAIYWASQTNPGGEARVRLALDAERHALLIGDNGRGIDARHRERIFDPYFSLNPDGHGLGLHVARELIEHQGGSLFLVHPDEALSLDARGATFCIILPRG